MTAVVVAQSVAEIPENVFSKKKNVFVFVFASGD